jgi:hypothetical protein
VRFFVGFNDKSALPLSSAVKACDEVSHGLIGTSGLHLGISSLFTTAFLAGEEALSLSFLILL